MSKESVRCIKRKHRMWERYMEDRSREKYREYCKARNKVKRVTRMERKKKEREVAKSSKANSKNFWKYVNSKRKSKCGISELHTNSDGKSFVATSDGDKAEVLADFFTTVFTNEDVTSMPPFDNRGKPQESFEDITEEEVRLLLHGLNTTKSAGPDMAHPKVLQELSSVIHKPLCMIFKSSLETGIVPECWKEAVISALFKKGDKRLASNYRPVSLTSILCKILEKVIRKRIIDHMDNQNLFSNKQFGFLGGRSTSLQLLSVLDSWTEILDRGGEVNTIYMDFMKAFDKVPHARLMKKMRAYNISETLCKWVEDFLSNRKQCVRVNGSRSSWHDITSGIPQGSVLGPVLFVIFINDLPECVKSSVFLFADDTKLFREIASTDDINILQSDLDSLFKWSKDWLLRFHPDKCKFLPIHCKNRSHVECEYKMKTYDGGSISLQTVENEKDIGVTVDNYLSFEDHMQIQVNKANKIVGLIRRSFVHLDNRTFSLLFKALVRPLIEYASSVWSPYKKKDIEIIENVQRRATRMLPQLKDLNYEERLRKLKLPTLKYRRMRGDMIETFKILTGIYDKRVASDMFKISETHITRGNAMKLCKDRSNKDIRKYSFNQRVIDIWNSLPNNVILSKSVNQFKNRLDELWNHHPLKFNHTEEINHYTGSRKIKVSLEDKEELPIEDREVLRAETI